MDGHGFLIPTQYDELGSTLTLTPLTSTQPGIRRRYERADLRCIQSTDLVYGRFGCGDVLVRFLEHHLPTQLITERQRAHSAEIERCQGKFALFGKSAEVW